MRIDFRQGIAAAPSGFLTVNGSSIDLTLPADVPAIITFADGQTNYVVTERKTVSSAWTIASGVDQWLFWEINTTTGARAFGKTLIQPIVGHATPVDPVDDQHWFDLTSTTMKVWNGTAKRWIRVVRTFACKLPGGGSPVSVSDNTPAFTGTQVGLNGSFTAGAIVFDAESGKALKRANGSFFTTEDKGFSHIASAAQVKLASVIIEGEAQENVPAYSVVRFTDYNKISLATSYTVDSGAYGIVETGVTTGETAQVVMEGLISNPQWDFTIAGGGVGDNGRFPAPLEVNAEIYVDTLGMLTSVPPPSAVVVAMVVDTNTILIRPSSLLEMFAPGNEVVPMTPSAIGIAKLSVAAADPENPIVVGDNDPRLEGIDALADLTTDVDLTTTPPNNGEVLTFDSGDSKWKPAVAGGGASYMDELGDTFIEYFSSFNIDRPQEGDVLVYSAPDDPGNERGTWIPGAVDLASLGDVNIGYNVPLAHDQVLLWNAFGNFGQGEWQNAEIPQSGGGGGAEVLNDLTDVDVEASISLAVGQMLVYQNTFNGPRWAATDRPPPLPIKTNYGAIVNGIWNIDFQSGFAADNQHVRVYRGSIAAYQAGEVRVQIRNESFLSGLTVGTEIRIEHWHEDVTTVTIEANPTAGNLVVINHRADMTPVINGRFGVVTLKYMGDNEWLLWGDLTPV